LERLREQLLLHHRPRQCRLQLRNLTLERLLARRPPAPCPKACFERLEALRSPRLDRLLRHRVLQRQLLDRGLPRQQRLHRLVPVCRAPPPWPTSRCLRLLLPAFRHTSAVLPVSRGDFSTTEVSTSGAGTEYPRLRRGCMSCGPGTGS